MHHAIARIRTLALIALLTLLAACGGSDDPVDLGHDDPHALGSALSDYAGTWQGRTEAYEFEDGSDELSLEVGVDGQGVLRLGDSLLPAPDPNHGFPPSLPSIAAPAPSWFGAIGFPFPILDARITENRIQISSWGGEVHREWCELMTPHLVTNAMPEHYACVASEHWTPIETGQIGQCKSDEVDDLVVDCNLLTCVAACECTQDACTVKDDFFDLNIQIDARLEDGGESFVGTLVLGSERIPVLMARM